MTVGELVAMLECRFDPQATIVATWEGVFRNIEVYASKGGTVVIDADHGYLRKNIESGELQPEKWLPGLAAEALEKEEEEEEP